ncbi:hypothetical protein NW762_013780 [Fusarium torreyae]|uniref:GPI inositol-deacylase winged helix domain-containing protein n=1 Tax=Fusarium torreyae TaxID=1237075 RepID=A0A9W8RLD7_9HYPO|nr:hypothetical protein NW762_013780 [Fusarium torreyae]
MEGRSVLEIRATKADVRQYLRHNMSKLSKFVMCDQELQEQICEAILGSIGGMFLLARLHLDSLVGKRSVKALKQALASLPKGSSAYDKAYLDAMNRIECQVPDLESLAKEVLAWLTFARRPLQIAELQAAIAIQETDSELDYESLIDIDDLVSICAGLVTIEPQSQTVTLTLIHYTTQEYLERTQARWRPDAHAAIATSCFTYLSFPALDVDFLKLDEYCFGKHIDGKLFPLLSYCIDHGALHAWRAMSEPPSIAHFLSSETKMPRNWLLLIAKHGGAPQAEATAEWLIERDVCINTRDPCNLRTILHYAVLNGWMRCVELMLQRNARLETDCFNMTPFHYTVKDNAQYMAQVFLDACITVDLPVTRRIYESTYQEGRVVYLPSNCVQTPIGETPTGKGLTGLHLATLTGCRQMTKFLLDHGADPNFPSDYGETPLHLALRQGFNNFESRVEDFWNNSDCRIECAIEYIDSTESDEECCSTQDWIEESRSTIVSLLLARADIDINAQDISGISPLHIAACSRWPSQSTIHKLLEKEAKVSLQTKEGKTPLHLAIENKNMDHFTALLRFGANPMDTSVNGLNALHYAARKVQMEMVEYLVSSISSTCREGFLKARDKHGETALHHLLRSRSPSSIIAVEYFLQRSVDVNDLNNAEMSPMATYLNTFVFCRGNDNAEVLRLLFENGADPTFETRDGLGLARLAARSRRVSPSLLKVLARRGVDIMAKDRQGRTVLHHMAIKGTLTEDVLHYICDDNRLFMEIQDTCQKTALDYAVEMQKKENRLSAFESNRRKRTEELLRKSRG